MEKIFDLIEQVKNIKSCVFAGITYRSTEKLPKAFGVVTKVVDKQVQLNYDYENAVNNRLKKAGKDANFKAESLPWGSWYVPNKVIVHGDEYYLRMYSYKGAPCTTEYYVDGRPATAAEVANINAYKDAHKKSSNRQAEVGLTEHQVEPMNVKFTNIIELRCGEIQYKEQQSVAV